MSQKLNVQNRKLRKKDFLTCCIFDFILMTPLQVTSLVLAIIPTLCLIGSVGYSIIFYTKYITHSQGSYVSIVLFFILEILITLLIILSIGMWKNRYHIASIIITVFLASGYFVMCFFVWSNPEMAVDLISFIWAADIYNGIDTKIEELMSCSGFRVAVDASKPSCRTAIISKIESKTTLLGGIFAALTLMYFPSLFFYISGLKGDQVQSDDQYDSEDKEVDVEVPKNHSTKREDEEEPQPNGMEEDYDDAEEPETPKSAKVPENNNEVENEEQSEYYDETDEQDEIEKNEPKLPVASPIISPKYSPKMSPKMSPKASPRPSANISKSNSKLPPPKKNKDESDDDYYYYDEA